MRQNTQLENSQVKLKTSDVTSPYENDLPVADLCGPVDFPPFQENKNVTDSQEKIPMYDTCFWYMDKMYKMGYLNKWFVGSRIIHTF